MMPREAGSSRAIGFDPAFSFDAPDGWVPATNTPGSDTFGAYVSNGSDPSEAGGVYFFRFDESAFDDQVDRLENSHQLEVSEPEAVEVGGAAGVRLVVTSPGIFALKSWPEGGSFTIGPEETGEYIIYILDVNGDTVMIAGGLAEGRQAIDDIADSIVWKDLN